MTNIWSNTAGANAFGKKTSDKVMVVDKGESNTGRQPAEVSREQALQCKALDLVD